MGSHKAPGFDGYSAMFFQKSWTVLKNDFAGEALRFLNDGVLDPSVNLTTTVLIPKVL